MMVKVCRYRKDTLPHQKRCKKYGIAKWKITLPYFDYQTPRLHTYPRLARELK